MFRNWPLLFIVIPLVELYCIITVGEVIGAFWTIILVLLTAGVGIQLMRFQGMSTLAKAQKNMSEGHFPAMEMMEGVALALAGVLLITPGFITDALGLLCLVPASRRVIIRYILARSTVQASFNVGSNESQQTYQQSSHRKESPDKNVKVGRTIEGEYKRED